MFGWFGHLHGRPTGSDQRRMNVAASDDYAASIWDAVTVTKSEKLVGHTGRVTETVFSPNGALVATVSPDGTGHLWEREDFVRIVPVGHSLLRTRVRTCSKCVPRCVPCIWTGEHFKTGLAN